MNQAECQAFIANLREGNRKFFADLRGRGALRQLNQNFTHGWVYIAELLQNAIDEQARHIRFTIDDGNLVFEHDGRAFSEDNVRGLCSTGLSTKGAGTVGFMGVGFKSVFHAFERVDVSSADWRFYLQVGWSTGSSQYGERIRDWLGAVLPYWSDQAEAPTAGMTCRFVFSRRNDGQPAIAQDLHRVLQSDLSLLPLLARRGIRCLDWNDDAWELACEEAPAPKNGVRLFHISATQPGGAEARSWGLFVSEYEPTKASIQQFLEHRQIVPPDPGPERDRFYDEAARMRSVEAFFEVGPDAVPRLPDVGRAFAVLPMELLLPLRLHIQADWLLVVTRADPKNLDDDTPWHRQIREQIPRLLAAYIAWLVSGSRSAGWAAGFEVLPDFRRTDTAGGQWLLCDAFRAQLRGELATLPFLPTFEAQGFVTPEVGLFAPGPFMPLFDAAWLPNYLFGQRAVAWQQLPPRTV
ncbi:MAG TPA: hypothetical protein VD973_11180, partial [Symbiobacteriaceae bacterium]|nr:hypothetical protein [Symbiobacteriaceae bacterium]